MPVARRHVAIGSLCGRRGDVATGQIMDAQIALGSAEGAIAL